MKKLVFTAIAMIAFSGASMANTKEAKKEVSLKVTTAVKKVLRRTYCDQVWINGYEYGLYVLGYGAGSSDAWAYADARATALGC